MDLGSSGLPKTTGLGFKVPDQFTSISERHLSDNDSNNKGKKKKRKRRNTSSNTYGALITLQPEGLKEGLKRITTQILPVTL